MDIPGSERFRNDYSRRQPYNANGTRLFGDQSSGYWGLYDAQSGVYLKRLNGPAGDCEIQWDASDPNTCWYLDNNGGTVFRKLNVVTNSNSVYWDFGAAVRALFGPSATRCWTKSEGSPSKNANFGA